ncbi:membrane protein [Streptomyces prasinosporus]|uniref:Membrane protein n=1 Tax=Streptomyces prasinosporus TaxID=68256 RepID=A0ABP6TQD0_9ACTN
MPTTRHHINRQRRRRDRETRSAAFDGNPERPGSRARAGGTAVLPPPRSSSAARPAGPAGRETRGATDRKADGPAGRRGRTVRLPRRPAGLAALCALTLLLGGFAGWARAEAEALRDEPARSNTALTDVARTSEIKGRAAEAVGLLFSYDHTDPGALGKAARDLLTGKAVDQHAALLADVRERADERKAVITTTVTESAVERIDGDRARVLVYADQSSVATAGGKGEGEGEEAARDEGAYAGAVLAVDLVHRGGRWLVSGIDTFGRP